MDDASDKRKMQDAEPPKYEGAAIHIGTTQC